MKQFGIALSGGGARGGAHVGALHILDEAGIRPEYIGGTSCGAIVGAFYAAGLPLDRQLAFADHLRWRSLRMLGMPRLGFFHSGEMERLLVRYLGPIRFEDLQIPLTVMAADFRTARPVVFREGPVARALSASAAIPVIFSPVIDGDSVLVDGGVVDNLPTQIVRGMGAEVVMAVNVVSGFSLERRYRNLFDMAMGTLDLLVKESTEHGSEAADLCLVPRVGHVHPSDLGKVRPLIEAGEQAMRESLPELRALLEESGKRGDLRSAG
jgi:NTE family protein